MGIMAPMMGSENGIAFQSDALVNEIINGNAGGSSGYWRTPLRTYSFTEDMINTYKCLAVFVQAYKTGGAKTVGMAFMEVPDILSMITLKYFIQHNASLCNEYPNIYDKKINVRGYTLTAGNDSTHDTFEMRKEGTTYFRQNPQQLVFTDDGGVGVLAFIDNDAKLYIEVVGFVDSPNQQNCDFRVYGLK